MVRVAESQRGKEAEMQKGRDANGQKGAEREREKVRRCRMTERQKDRQAER